MMVHVCSELVYFYQLGSSGGYSPHPCHWRGFIRQYGDKLGGDTDRGVALGHDMV